MLRRLILVIACLGTLLFSGAFFVSWLHPIALERIAHEAVRLEVERRVGERIESLSGSRMAVLAQKAMGRTDEEIARTDFGTYTEDQFFDDMARVTENRTDPDLAEYDQVSAERTWDRVFDFLAGR